MRILEIYSHLNGVEFLSIRRPSLWQEIKDRIEGLDISDCAHMPLSSNDHSPQGQLSPTSIKDALNSRFEELGWRKRAARFWAADDAELTKTVARMPVDIQRRIIKFQGAEPISSLLKIDLHKDRVAVEVEFGNSSKVAHDINLTYLNFYGSDLIDVGIKILAMKELESQMSSGVPYYERDLLNIIRQGRGVPAVPLVLMGIAL